MTTFVIHCNHVRIYLNHRAETHDMIQVVTTQRRLEKATRYNREIFRMTHHSSDLVMLYQKRSEKLKSRWRDSLRIQSHDDSHDVSFILIQLNDRKIRNAFMKIISKSSHQGSNISWIISLLRFYLKNRSYEKIERRRDSLVCWWMIQESLLFCSCFHVLLSLLSSLFEHLVSCSYI